MARQRRAKRVSSRGAATEGDDMQNMPERAVESLTEIAAASGAQAVRFAAAIARGMAKGVAGAARELRRPVGEMTEAAADTVRILRDSTSKGVERATKGRRGTTSSGAPRGSGSAKRRSV
jgi:hypothetical protein